MNRNSSEVRKEPPKVLYFEQKELSPASLIQCTCNYFEYKCITYSTAA